MAARMEHVTEEDMKSDNTLFLMEMENILATLCEFSKTKRCPQHVKLEINQLARIISVK